MRTKLLCLIVLMCISYSGIAQEKPTDFSKLWAATDSLILQQNLTKTAIAQTDRIYLLAKKEKQTDQQIKALLYKISLNEQVAENSSNECIRLMEQEINICMDPVMKALLYTILAKQYFQYYQYNRWVILGIKKSTGFDTSDIKTWPAAVFQKKINEGFSKALEQSDLLSKSVVDSFACLLIYPNKIHSFSLFDLIASEAIGFYHFEQELFASSAQFEPILKNDACLYPLDQFLLQTFTRKDTGESFLKTIQLYQQVLRLHTADKNTSLLIYWDIERIQWCRQKQNLPSKEYWYQLALRYITSTFANTAESIKAWYILAEHEKNLGNEYRPGTNEPYRYRLNNALAICDTAKKKYGAEKWKEFGFHDLQLSIYQHKIRTETEKINSPQKAFRTNIHYRNIDTLYVKVVRIDPKKNYNPYNFNEDILAQLNSLPIAASYIQALPDTKDHQEHSVEMKLNGLPTGSYALISSSGSGFEKIKHYNCVTYFSVSDLMYLKDGYHYFIRDIQTGSPIKNASVKLYQTAYDYRTGQTTKSFIKEIYADNNGFFSLKNIGRRERVALEITHGKQYLYTDASEYLYEDEAPETDIESTARQYENNNKRAFFFTDRSIYRPGQKIYFKAVALTRDFTTQQSKLVSAKEPLTVLLKNANRQTIDSVELRLNEFGSMAGSFNIPSQGLTGQFSLEVKNYRLFTGNYFSVEEYKRPSFQIRFTNTKTSFKLNDSIYIKGLASSYAGNAINHAQVVYTVKELNFNYNKTREDEIADTTYTNENGLFTIPFFAKKESLSNDRMLVNYEIVATIKDITSETHTEKTNVLASNIAWNIRINHQPSDQLSIEKSTLNEIAAELYDQYGNIQSGSVHIRLFKANAPDRMIRKRLWERPDQYLMTEEEFVLNFPHDEYRNETDYPSWPLQPIALKDSIINGVNAKSIPVDKHMFSAGIYKIEASAIDTFGKTIRSSQYLYLYDAQKKILPISSFAWNGPQVATAEPGDTVHLFSGSGLSASHVIQKINSGIRQYQHNDADQYRYLTRKGFTETTIIPDESNRGSIIITEAFVAMGRIYTNQFNITIPWNNKKLQLKYGSFRSISEPGSKETYTVEVNGLNGEKKAAELLTGMYDASLDALKNHAWVPLPVGNLYSYSNQFFTNLFTVGNVYELPESIPYLYPDQKQFPELAANGTDLWRTHIRGWNNYTPYTQIKRMDITGAVSAMADGGGSLNEMVTVGASARIPPPAPIQIMIRGTNRTTTEESYNKVFTSVDVIDPVTGLRMVNGRIVNNVADAKSPDQAIVQIRKDFNETAFFFPQLQADSNGVFRFSFTMPDAVSKWKWMSVAHTKDISFGMLTKEIITQKTLMVQPNIPRFLREGDQLEFSTKVANLSNKELTGTVGLELLDATTNKPVDGWFQNIFPRQYFTAEAGQSAVVKFPVQIPFSYNKPLIWRIIAQSGNYSDGEENIIPVITNRQLITETLPLLVKTGSTKTYSFTKLLNNNSGSLTHQGLTVEYTSNPVWNVVQALPYLMDCPNESAEQLYNRIFTNLMAAYIVKKNPGIESVFTKWEKDSAALKSNLEKNTELKQIVLSETPWVLSGKNETQQKRQIAQLMNASLMNGAVEKWIAQLEDLQLAEGALPWFKGGYADWQMTQYVLTGIGKLKRLGAISPDIAMRLKPFILKALMYQDEKMSWHFEQLKKNKVDLNKWAPGSYELDYLWMRSFYNDIVLTNKDAVDFYYAQAKKYRIKQNLYYQAVLALIAHRNNETQWAVSNILPSILENTVIGSAQGMYWKNPYIHYWYQQPVEYQSKMIECFSEINRTVKSGQYTDAISDMRTWLILNKQTNNWKTTIATAEACYALLMNDGIGSLNSFTPNKVEIALGEMKINSALSATEAGSGYFKQQIAGEKIVPEMGHIKVSVKSDNEKKEALHIAGTGNLKSDTHAKTQQITYGSVYWQYLEDLDKITPAAGPLSLDKKILVERDSPAGKIFTVVNDNDEIKTGDHVLVQLTLKTDRDMEYLHLKDLRAAALEPVNVLSGYKWKNELGYYESTRDVSSNFFISFLPKGTYIFSYDLRATQTGIFSSGIASIQSMYAPEFTSHSAGIRVRVKD